MVQNLANTRLNIQQIVDIAREDETLRTQAQNNPYDDFILGFRKRFMDYVVEGFEKTKASLKGAGG